MITNHYRAVRAILGKISEKEKAVNEQQFSHLEMHAKIPRKMKKRLKAQGFIVFGRTAPSSRPGRPPSRFVIVAKKRTATTVRQPISQRSKAAA